MRDKNENKQSALKDWLRKNELFVEVEEEEISEEEALALKEEEEKRIEEKEQKKEERIAAAAEKREKDRESFRIFLGKANDFLYRVRESLQFAAEQAGTFFRNTSEKIRNAVSEKKFDPFYVVVPLVSLLIIGASWLFASGIFEDPGYDIILNDSGRITQVTTTERTVGEFIRANGFGYTAADRLDAEFSDTLYDGMTITIYRSVDVTINKAGEIYETKMLAGTVADAIRESGITLGENDEVYPALETYITEATTIDIIEVEYVFEKELTTLHYTETEKNDPTLAKGKTVVKQEGEDGYKESTIRITLKNGREVARETVEEIVLKEPVTEITLIGTYVKPTPTPKPTPVKTQPTKTKTPSAAKTKKPSDSSSNVNWKTNSEGKLIEVPTVSQIHSSTTLYQHKNVPPPDESIIAKTVILDDCTAYTHTGNKTATGTWPRIGTVAADPKRFPYGTKVYVPGYGYGRIEDTGSMRHREHVLWDLFMDTEKECRNWGRKHNVKAYVLVDD
ncbi:MAG: G5 domain-containing protein [Christensenellaceae bacterium]|nr:G5 domain-containing protein [Christensenellaceae bacterium]